eukprot:gene5173-6441_t
MGNKDTTTMNTTITQFNFINSKSDQSIHKSNNNNNKKESNIIIKYLKSVRLWTLPFVFLSAGIGCLLAYKEIGELQIPVILIMIAIQSVLVFLTNLVNSYYDFVNEIDTYKSAGDRTMFDFGVSTGDMLSFINFTVYTFLSLLAVLYFYIPSHQIFFWKVLPFTFLSFFFALAYTLPPFSLKYYGLGEFCVVFGLVTFIPFFYYTQTYHFHWKMIHYSIPFLMSIATILHSNNLRDLDTDKKSGIFTFAIFLGKDLSYFYYFTLYFGFV